MESFYVSINREKTSIFLLHITKYTKETKLQFSFLAWWQIHLMFVITECAYNMSCHKQYYEASKTQLQMFDIYRRQARLVIKLV